MPGWTTRNKRLRQRRAGGPAGAGWRPPRRLQAPHAFHSACTATSHARALPRPAGAYGCHLLPPSDAADVSSAEPSPNLTTR